VRKTSRPSEEDRQALVAELAERLRRTSARAMLFFDGPAGQRGASLGALSVQRSTGASADDAIVREVERARAPAEMTVVTADRGLASRVRDAGGKICSPADFFARFGTSRQPEEARAAVERVDVEEWMKYFGDERNRDGE
jgi:hypothetical protein